MRPTTQKPPPYVPELARLAMAAGPCSSYPREGRRPIASSTPVRRPPFPDMAARQGGDVVYAGQRQRAFELVAQQRQAAVDPCLSAGRQPIELGPPAHAGRRPQRARLAPVRAA